MSNESRSWLARLPLRGQRFRLLALGLPLLCATGAHAATITIATAGFQFSQDVLGGPPTTVLTSPVCNSSTSTASVVGGIAAGGPCSGALTLLPGAGAGAFSAEAAGSGRFDADGLQLGVMASVDISRTLNQFGGTGGYTYGTNLTASTTFADSVTLSGGAAGSAGFLRLAFDIDGETQLGPIGGFTYAWASPSLTVNGVQRPLGSGSNASQFDIPLIFGEAATLNVMLSAWVGASMMVPPEPFASADFSHTARLTLAQVLDADGNLLAGGRINSEAGLGYQPNETPASVPEPSTLLLLGSGAAGLVARRFRRGASTRETSSITA